MREGGNEVEENSMREETKEKEAALSHDGSILKMRCLPNTVYHEAQEH